MLTLWLHIGRRQSYPFVMGYGEPQNQPWAQEACLETELNEDNCRTNLIPSLADFFR